MVRDKLRSFGCPQPQMYPPLHYISVKGAIPFHEAGGEIRDSGIFVVALIIYMLFLGCC